MGSAPLFSCIRNGSVPLCGSTVPMPGSLVEVLVADVGPCVEICNA